MGTNFYLAGRPKNSDAMDPKWHIGKRSAAGSYCWDCNVTLCREGEAGIHTSTAPWHHKCPRCGKQGLDEDLTTSSAGRELGFNKAVPVRKKGVASCCSFTWAMDRDMLRHRILGDDSKYPELLKFISTPAPKLIRLGAKHALQERCYEVGYKAGYKAGAVALRRTQRRKIQRTIQQSLQSQCIVDEYSKHYTWAEFNQVLDECPVQYRHLIGNEFS